MFGVRGEMKKRTDQIMNCIDGVKPLIKDLTETLDELNETIKKNSEVDPQVLKNLGKLSRDLNRDFSDLGRYLEAHSKVMLKISEEMKE